MGILICQADATVVLCATGEILTITETLTAVGKCSDHLLSIMDWMVLTMANEKRLIDANALLAELDKFANPMPNKSGYDFLCGVASVITEVECAPTVDAVEIVRCEKCKHAVWDEEYEMWKCVESAEYDEESCVWFGFCEYHYGDFFCSYGERKEGAD